MARLDHDRRNLVASVVLAGPRGAGKTSMLGSIRSQVQPAKIRSATSGTAGPTRVDDLLLDWLPLDLGKIGGWRVQLDLYSLSSTHSCDATRRLLLADADGLLMVLDSQASKLDEDLSFLRELQEELLDREGDLRDLPQVFCYSKSDLPAELLLTKSALDDALNFRAAPSLDVDLLRGVGVLESLHAMVTLVMRRLSAAPPKSQVGSVEADPVMSGPE